MPLFGRHQAGQAGRPVRGHAARDKRLERPGAAGQVRREQAIEVEHHVPVQLCRQFRGHDAGQGRNGPMQEPPIGFSLCRAFPDLGGHPNPAISGHLKTGHYG